MVEGVKEIGQVGLVSASGETLGKRESAVQGLRIETLLPERANLQILPLRGLEEENQPLVQANCGAPEGLKMEIEKEAIEKELS